MYPELSDIGPAAILDIAMLIWLSRTTPDAPTTRQRRGAA